MERLRLPRRLAALSIVVTNLTLACAGDGGTFAGPRGSREAAKGGGSTGVTVTASTPSFGSPGTINETITISGSGFQSGAQAAWLQLNDSLDTTITVLSTQVVNSSTVTSVISISTNSPIAFRNVKVTNADRTKGIGNSVFEVTQAVLVPGSNILRAANDNGDLVGGAPKGGGPVLWNATNGLIHVGADTGTGQSVSGLGNAIGANNLPRLYTRPGPVGSPWQLTLLPTSPGAGGGALAMLSDPTTGQPLIIGGRQVLSSSRRSSITEPMVWTWQSSTGSWQMQVLPAGSTGSGTVKAISTDTTVVGWLGGATTPLPSSGTTAAAWRVDGTGAWHLTTIGATGNSGAQAINSAGTLIVGMSGGFAVYWVRGADGSWGSPVTLPGGCTDALGVDTSGRILVAGCVTNTNEPAGVMSPPYSASNIRFLGGLGPKNAAFVEGMSPSGEYVVGQAGGGVYWKLF